MVKFIAHFALFQGHSFYQLFVPVETCASIVRFELEDGLQLYN